MRVSGPLLEKSAAWRSMLRMHPEADLGHRLDVTFQSPQYPRLDLSFSRHELEITERYSLAVVASAGLSSRSRETADLLFM